MTSQFQSTISLSGELVNMLKDEGISFNWPGMLCGEHPGGRAVGLYQWVGARSYLIAVVPCSPSVDETIWKAVDMLTYPGGVDAWHRAKML